MESYGTTKTQGMYMTAVTVQVGVTCIYACSIYYIIYGVNDLDSRSKL